MFRCLAAILLVVGLLAGTRPAVAGEEAIVVSTAKPDAGGVLVHDVRSPYEAGVTTIRVILPAKLDPTKAYAVVYLLPVEAGDGHRYGDPMAEAKKADLANRYDAILVSPTFSALPWYADHPTDPTVRQESYLLRAVLPFVESHYPARSDPGGRLLVGFSKSGWGAFALLLRHPDLFARAAAWDAPLMMDWPTKYRSAPIFATRENFERYHVARLLADHAAELRESERLVLLGYGNFRADHQQAHALMDRLGIRHAYVDGPPRPHEWGSGWLADAMSRLHIPEPRSRSSTAAP